MRKLTTIMLVGAATIAVTAITGGSAYAGETATTRLDSPGVVVAPSGTEIQDDERYPGCRSHRKELTNQTQSINQ